MAEVGNISNKQKRSEFCAKGGVNCFLIGILNNQEISGEVGWCPAGKN